MIVKIEGMMCNHCVNRVNKGLTENGATNVEVGLEKKQASFENLSYEKAKEIIEDLGFDVVG